MGIFNEHGAHSIPYLTGGFGKQGPQDPPGPKFFLDRDGENEDAINKHQLDTTLNTKVDKSGIEPNLKK